MIDFAAFGDELEKIAAGRYVREAGEMGKEMLSRLRRVSPPSGLGEAQRMAEIARKRGMKVPLSAISQRATGAAAREAGRGATRKAKVPLRIERAMRG